MENPEKTAENPIGEISLEMLLKCAEGMPFVVAFLHYESEKNSMLRQVEKLREKYGRQLMVFCFYRESARSLGEELNIIGTPTVIVFSDGVEVNRVWGKAEYESLTRIIDYMKKEEYNRKDKERRKGEEIIN